METMWLTSAMTHLVAIREGNSELACKCVHGVRVAVRSGRLVAARVWHVASM